MAWLASPDPGHSGAALKREPLRIVGGLDEVVGLWLIDRLPDVMTLPGGYVAIGVARGDELIGGCLYTNFTRCPGGGDIQIWAAGRDWVSRKTIRAMLGYPFDQLGCHRITALAARGNRKSRALMEGLGFKLEGVARKGMGPRTDAMIYGLLREDNKWR